MKVVFICGSLAPGLDGVGDYTRNLALEVLTLGHDVSLIALADKYTDIIIEEKLSDQHGGGKILRIPGVCTSGERRRLASDVIATFKPDWVSIQFVIYNYHPKGLPFGLHRLMGNISKNIKVHLMFHELWIGTSPYSPIKHKVYGYFQKKIIESVIEATRPKLISTSNILYRYILGHIKIQSIILPLFSNIRVAPVDKKFLTSVLTRLDIQNESELSRWNIVGTFGKLHPDTKIEPILIQEIDYSQKLGLNIAFVAFGKIGEQGLQEFNRLQRALSPAIKFLYLAELSPGHVSNVLQLLNKGISSTPLHYIGKSGVFAAMKLHNVDVIIPEESMFPQFDAKVKKFVSGYKKQSSIEWDVTQVAKKFLSVLQ